MKKKFKRIACIGGILIAGLLVIYYNQPRYKICCGVGESPDKPLELEGKCLKLSYSLDQVEAMYPKFCVAPYTLLDSYYFGIPETATDLRRLSKNILNKIVNAIEYKGNHLRFTLSKVFYDYFSKEPQEPYSSSFFRLLPSNGTYFLKYHPNNFLYYLWLEIDDRGITLVSKAYGLDDCVYILDDKYAGLPMKDLKKEHFVKLKNADENLLIRLYSSPFGTYLIHFHFVDGERYCILSVYPN